ncbi:Fc.00g033540.m01.CDS01 [Cosmosporella sp. VM-42]
MSKRVRTIATRVSRPRSATAPTQSAAAHLFEDAKAWETWLEGNHKSNNGIWLKLNKKGSRVATVTYDEALDVALCFGWIDGQKKRHDEQHFIQRFTPRRKSSLWSKRNGNKVAVLIESGRMKESGQAEIDAAKADGRWERAYAGSSSIQVPADFQAALDENKKAREFFESINRTQRFAFLQRIETAKKPETRQRRIEQFVELLADHKCLH